MPTLIQPNSPTANERESDPNFFAQIARGKTSEAQLAEILRGAQMQQAMKLQNARMSPVQPQGLATRRPSAFDAFAQMAQNYRGNQKMDSLQAQAQALRGDASAGQQAQLEQQAFERDQDYQRKLERDEQTYMRNRELQQAGMERFTGDARMYETPDGIREVFMTGRGPVSADGTRINDMTGWKEVESAGNRYLSAFGGGLRSKQERQELLENYDALGDLNVVQEVAADFDDKDLEILNRAGKDVLTKAVTPSNFQNYVNTNLKDASPEVLEYLEAINRYTAHMRKNLSGTALTKMEMELSELFLPGASGLNYEDRMRRLDAYAKKHKRTIENIGRINKGDPEFYLKDAPEYRSYEERKGQSNADPMKKLEDLSAKIEAANARMKFLSDKAKEP